MAYFPNGMSFCAWKEGQCYDCLNHRDNGSGSYGCAITDAHFLLADKLHDSNGERSLVAETLEHFIPDGGDCKMRLTQKMLETEERERNYQLDLERYEAAMAERS